MPFRLLAWILTTIVVLTTRVAAAPPKPVPPAAVRATLPGWAEWEGSLPKDGYLLVWYHRKGKTDERYLAVRRLAGRRCVRIRTVRLKNALSFAQDDYLGSGDPALARPRWDWLRPRQTRGPILTLGEKFYRTFYVFPQGVRGPVVTWSSGGGSSWSNCILVERGGVDKRGYRIIQSTSVSSARDDNDNPYDEKQTWSRYWTGDGWMRKGPERDITRQPN